MIHVCRVDVGSRHVFDSADGINDVGSLVAFIERCFKIDRSKQTLLVSGGEVLDNYQQKLYCLSGGRDENCPIYLIDKNNVEREQPPAIDTPLSSFSQDMRQEIQAAISLLPSFQTLQTRSQLANRVYELGKNLHKLCQSFYDDQFWQYQGFLALIANLDEYVSSFRKKEEIIRKHFDEYFLNQSTHRELLNDIDSYIDILAHVPLLPQLLLLSHGPGGGTAPADSNTTVVDESTLTLRNAPQSVRAANMLFNTFSTQSISSLQQQQQQQQQNSQLLYLAPLSPQSPSSPSKLSAMQSEPPPLPTTTATANSSSSSGDGSSVGTTEIVSLLDWVKSTDPQNKLSAVIEETRDMLANFESSLKWRELTARVNRELDQIDTSTQMRDIDGLTKRLQDLNSFLERSNQLLRSQGEIAESFNANFVRATSLKDESILHDLCQGHERQLEIFKSNHAQMNEITTKMSKAKLELVRVVHFRLRWVMQVQNQVSDLDFKMQIYYKQLKRLNVRLKLLEQLRKAPNVYMLSMRETVRRQNFSQAYKLFAQLAGSLLDKVQKSESKRREAFDAKMAANASHFVLNILFRSLSDKVEPVMSADASALRFDSQLPNVSESQLSQIESDLIKHLTPSAPASLPSPQRSCGQQPTTDIGAAPHTVASSSTSSSSNSNSNLSSNSTTGCSSSSSSSSSSTQLAFGEPSTCSSPIASPADQPSHKRMTTNAAAAAAAAAGAVVTIGDHSSLSAQPFKNTRSATTCAFRESFLNDLRATHNADVSNADQSMCLVNDADENLQVLRLLVDTLQQRETHLSTAAAATSATADNESASKVPAEVVQLHESTLAAIRAQIDEIRCKLATSKQTVCDFSALFIDSVKQLSEHERAAAECRARFNAALLERVQTILERGTPQTDPITATDIARELAAAAAASVRVASDQQQQQQHATLHVDQTAMQFAERLIAALTHHCAESRTQLDILKASLHALKTSKNADRQIHFNEAIKRATLDKDKTIDELRARQHEHAQQIEQLRAQLAEQTQATTLAKAQLEAEAAAATAAASAAAAVAAVTVATEADGTKSLLDKQLEASLKLAGLDATLDADTSSFSPQDAAADEYKEASVSIGQLMGDSSACASASLTLSRLSDVSATKSKLRELMLLEKIGQLEKQLALFITLPVTNFYETIQLNSCNIDDLVVAAYSEEYGSYKIIHKTSSYLHFVHSAIFKTREQKLSFKVSASPSVPILHQSAASASASATLTATAAATANETSTLIVNHSSGTGTAAFSCSPLNDNHLDELQFAIGGSGAASNHAAETTTTLATTSSGAVNVAVANSSCPTTDQSDMFVRNSPSDNIDNIFSSDKQPHWFVGRVLVKEFCIARRENNRFRVPCGTRFYRVKLKPYNL